MCSVTQSQLTNIFHHPCQQVGCQWSHLTWLTNHSIASSQSWCYLECQQEEWQVPGAYQASYSNWSSVSVICGSCLIKNCWPIKVNIARSFAKENYCVKLNLKFSFHLLTCVFGGILLMQRSESSNKHVGYPQHVPTRQVFLGHVTQQ